MHLNWSLETRLPQYMTMPIKLIVKPKKKAEHGFFIRWLLYAAHKYCRKFSAILPCCLKQSLVFIFLLFIFTVNSNGKLSSEEIMQANGYCIIAFVILSYFWTNNGGCSLESSQRDNYWISWLEDCFHKKDSRLLDCLKEITNGSAWLGLIYTLCPLFPFVQIYGPVRHVLL